MYEFTIENKITREIQIVYGRNRRTVWERNHLDENEWNVLDTEYID